MVQVGEELVVIGGGPDSYGTTQVLSLRSLEWREGRPPQKDRALHDCSLVVTEEGEGVLVAGNDFSPMDLAEVRPEHSLTVFQYCHHRSTTQPLTAGSGPRAG